MKLGEEDIFEDSLQGAEARWGYSAGIQQVSVGYSGVSEGLCGLTNRSTSLSRGETFSVLIAV
ncbi:hypothetical protein EYF80_019354 [Liparis tanakae]|uniref:Uncharacterized protein n=1 Tax=Liparis tanakae TaxID=230148 RepID=A0A4Z2HXQ1_9TELE|nr:hypothetical protein EYF80_019354 [Liparis tanakae]